MKYSYKIVVDSCCELPKYLEEDERFEIVPFTMEIGDYEVADDSRFDKEDFLEIAKESCKCPNSSSPSPESFMNAFRTDADRIYVITLSSYVSSSYSSALLAARLFCEDVEKKDIYVIDSRSAACGETQIALKLMDLEEKSLSFDQITAEIQLFVEQMKTYLVLNDMEYLTKIGRISASKIVKAGTLPIRQILSTAKDGSIAIVGQAVGMKKAVHKIVDTILKTADHAEKNRIVISHSNCLETVEMIKKVILERTKNTDVIIMNNEGVNSVYVNDGVMISF